MSIKKYDNQSNPFSSNMFETSVGVSNIAPIKISGQYKIVVGIDNLLYLDDYTGRRVIVDKTKTFLPQVANFLKLKSNISDINNLRYGAFQRSTKNHYHIPLYLGNSELPKYYVLSRVVNETITDVSFLYKYGKIQQVIDLTKIGLTNIFNEILSEDFFSYPLYFKFEENLIDLFGYSIETETVKKYSLSTLNSQANQPYFDVLNNTILNTFDSQGLIYPKFINLEFEFEYQNEYVYFNNFYGYLSTGNKIQIVDLVDDFNFNIKIQDFKDNFIWKQQTSIDKQSTTNPIVLSEYVDIIGGGSVQEIAEQPLQYRFLLNILFVDDTISIYHPDGSIYFEYIIKPEDVVDSSLLQSTINICHSATKQSKNTLIFSVKELSNKSCVITIVFNFSDTLDNLYTIELPNYCLVLDRDKQNPNYSNFRGISLNDIWLIGQPNLLDNQTQISIDSVNYNITDRFKFNDKTIIRLDKSAGLKKLSECKIYQTKTEDLIALNPLPFLNFNSKLKSYLPFDKDAYIANLKTKFTSVENIINIDNFKKSLTESFYQYTSEDLSKLTINDVESIELIDNNQSNCLNMMFNSVGQTSYLTPNILNIDKQFYLQNGNIDIDNIDDVLKFNWFLIKGECPAYLQNDIRSLRYFTGGSGFEQNPKITSTLSKTTEDFCETIFLGVKYQLPIRYIGYKFAVYFNFNSKNDIDLNYLFEVNEIQKTIYLSINKYLDFVDLIRGGNENATPLLDLSFFYSVTESFNTTSTYTYDLSECSMIFGEENNYPISFPGIDGESAIDGITSWYLEHPNNKKYFALRLEIGLNKINDFKLLFHEESDVENSPIYIYQDFLQVNGTVINVPYFEIKLINVVAVEPLYVWCEDIRVTGQKTDDICYAQVFDNITQKNKTVSGTISNLQRKSPNIWGDYISTAIIGSDNVELVLTNKIISILDSYFEITQNGVSKTLTKFNNASYAEYDLIEMFNPEPVDKSITSSKITLFDRNQIWYNMRGLLKNSAKLKSSTKEIIRSNFDKFYINDLKLYSDSNSFQIKNSSEFLNMKIIETDKNVVIWDILNDKKLISIQRQHCEYHPYLELFENELEFQLPVFKQNNSIHNIYDKNFGGLNVSATGIWNEVSGNIVSSLFCKKANINVKADFSTTINYFDLLLQTIEIEKLIITNWNTAYIENFNKNTNAYILDSYVKYLLKNFYYLDSVINELSQRITYITDTKNSNILYFNDLSTYQQNFKYLTFIFKRK